MADNVTLPGTGAVVGADEVTIGGVPQMVQRVKLVDGTDGGTELLPGSNARGLAVDPRQKVARLQVTPTISLGAYTSGDAVGGIMQFAGAARSAGGGGVIQAITVLDKTQAQRAPIDLVFFDRTFTAPGDNNPFVVSDADMLNCLGVVSIGAYQTAWPGTPANSISTLAGVCLLPFVLNGTDLFCQAVVRATPTYTAADDLVFTLHVLQN